MHAMQDDQNGQKTMVLTSAEETGLTFLYDCKIYFSLVNNIGSLTADVNTIMNLPWYPRKIIHFSLVLSPTRPFYGSMVLMSTYMCDLDQTLPFFSGENISKIGRWFY
jgi:hypothetical protein